MPNKKLRIIDTVAIITIIAAASKVLGFLREMIIAYVFGAGAVTDAYAIAARIVGTAALLANVYFSSVFLPTYTRLRENRSEESALSFANNSLGVTLVVNAVLMVLLQLTAPLVLKITGFDVAQASVALTAVRILLFQLPFMAFLSLFIGYLTARKSFFGPNLVGYPLNITIITVCLLMGTRSGVVELSVAGLLSVISQIIFLLIWLPKEKYRYRFSARFNTPEIRDGIRLMIPALLGFAVADLNAWVDTVIATYLGEGSAAAIRFAAQLIAFVNLLIVPASGVVFSYLSDYAAKNDTENMLAVLWKTIRAILFIVIPIVIIAIPTSGDIVRIVYQRGEFTSDAASLTASAFAWYLPGLLGIAAHAFLLRFYHALQDTKTPMLCGIVSVSVNIVLSILLSRVMGIAGVALATSIGTLISALLLIIALRRKMGPMGFGETAIDIGKMILSAIPCVLAVLGSGFILSGTGALVRFAACTMAGGAAYLVPAFLLKEMALRDLMQRFLPMSSHRPH